MRGVRVVCGDWKRVCGGNWQTNTGICGIFFDPPYSDVADRCKNIYAVDSESVAHDVQKWCLERGANKKYRIVLAGYYEEHKRMLKYDWTVIKWKAQGGYANTAQQAEPEAKPTGTGRHYFFLRIVFGKERRRRECDFINVMKFIGNIAVTIAKKEKP